jgi:hypothetical protein
VRLVIAYPPYPPHRAERHDLADGSARLVTRSRARRWYGDGPRDRGGRNRPADYHPEAAVWDHPARHRLLLEQLIDEADGWAIATTMDGLDAYRPLPVPARTLVWVKTNALPTSHRIEASCEAVIVCPPVGRRARVSGEPQVPDVLVAGKGKRGFAGAKPAVWTRWVLAALGYDPAEDEVVDMFPGSGAVSAAADGMLL